MGEGGQGRKRQARLIQHRNTTPDRLLRCNQLGFGAVDLLVNNAGNVTRKRLDEEYAEYKAILTELGVAK